MRISMQASPCTSVGGMPDSFSIMSRTQPRDGRTVLRACPPVILLARWNDNRRSPPRWRTPIDRDVDVTRCGNRRSHCDEHDKVPATVPGSLEKA